MTHLPRVIFSGSREFRDPEPVRMALESLRKKGDWRVVHGAARGLDSLAGELAPGYSFEVEAHPAEWDKHKRAAGHIRNQKMVDLGALVAFAFPLGESRGTRDFIRRARAAQIPVLCWEGGIFQRIP